jgi:hypothetical protein
MREIVSLATGVDTGNEQLPTGVSTDKSRWPLSFEFDPLQITGGPKSRRCGADRQEHAGEQEEQGGKKAGGGGGGKAEHDPLPGVQEGNLTTGSLIFFFAGRKKFGRNQRKNASPVGIFFELLSGCAHGTSLKTRVLE